MVVLDLRIVGFTGIEGTRELSPHLGGNTPSIRDMGPSVGALASFPALGFRDRNRS